MTDPTDEAIAAAKQTLANANALTTTADGTPTSSFAPKVLPSHINGVPQHEYSGSPYSQAMGLRAKKA